MVGLRCCHSALNVVHRAQCSRWVVDGERRREALQLCYRRQCEAPVDVARLLHIMSCFAVSELRARLGTWTRCRTQHVQLVPIPKAAPPDLQCGTCPSSPSSLPTLQDPPMPYVPFHQFSLSDKDRTVPGDSFPKSCQALDQRHPLPNRPVPNRRRWFTLRPPPMCPSMTPQAAVFTGVSRTKSDHFQAPNLKTTTTTPPGSSPTKHSPS
ncbi:hypothetical protein JB92DRAFT_2016448 [Gautieria morchelliformis]|nr:hypothetical protein JB92DRAFT_2016448 [Gautieria morchelliformis]